MYGDCRQVVMQQSSPTMMMMGSSGGGGEMVVGMNMSNMVAAASAPTDPLFSSLMPNPNNHLSGFSMGGIMQSPFHLNAFSSSVTTIMPKEVVVVGRKVEEMQMDYTSGSAGSGHLDGLSCGEEINDTTQQQQQQQHQEAEEQKEEQQQQQKPQAKKKRFNRHTAHQIQEMEALFRECPHPDDKQRMKLSQELGLKPRQVKFWFQNRRTQMKAQQDRADNAILRAENDSLKSDNFRLQTAIRSLVCTSCGGGGILGETALIDEHHLRLENSRLKEELDKLSCMATRFGGRPAAAPPPLLLPSLDLDMGVVYSRNFNDIIQFPPTIPCGGGVGGGGVYVLEQDKPLVLDLAITATEQLVRMCRTGDPLWGRGGGTSEKLNLEEHGRMFSPWPVDAKQKQPRNGELRTEATRSSGHVMMNSVNLVDSFMDVNKWMELFPSIVSSAKTLQVINPRTISGTNGGGSVQLMYVELQFLSPLVPTREAYFFRYCHHNAEEGFWTVVDFPADGFIEELQTSGSAAYKRLPSGCVFQDMPNGYSVVQWVEQADLEEKPVHQIFHLFVDTGAAFGAHRWVAVLQHQCDRLASLMARNVSDLGVIPSLEARTNLMMLSQRMIRTFCSNIGSSGKHQSWTALSDSSEDTTRITTRKNTEPGQPNGVILTAVSTMRLPFSHLQVFELLTDENRRSRMDVLSCGNSLHEVAHIANGSHQKNCVSLLRINGSGNSSQNMELMLQESTTHPTAGSLVVYSTVDVDAVQVAMSGEDPSYIPLLPTGFVVLPALPPASTNDGQHAAGCLLTVGIQVLASAVPSAKISLSSVTAINNHLCNVVDQIRAALDDTTGAAASGP